MKKIGRKLDQNIELLEFFKVYKQAKAYCLLLRDEKQFRSMRKGLNSSYGKLAEIRGGELPKNSLALHVRAYADAVNAELMISQLRSQIYKSD